MATDQIDLDQLHFFCYICCIFNQPQEFSNDNISKARISADCSYGWFNDFTNDFLIICSSKKSTKKGRKLRPFLLSINRLKNEYRINPPLIVTY